MDDQGYLQVAIVGAGPAGLFAAEALAGRGYGVALFNRDIKPGGLAEYGIFPDKFRLKDGLRNQFKTIFSDARIQYFGNVQVGIGQCLQLQTLFDWGFSAVLVTCGAQGIKSLHLPGEKLAGVIHAKDLVYYYNHLPPYASNLYQFGRKAAIVGAGNVMADVAHYLLKHTTIEEIRVVIRRGPGEVKFDKKEMEPIIAYLDQEAFEGEMSRVSQQMRSVGQDPQEAKERILAALPKACPKERDAALFFNFLSSPVQLMGDHQVEALEIEQNELVIKDGEVSARGTGIHSTLAVDTVIFAIGDRVLGELGLPVEHNEFCVSKIPSFPIDGISYEIEDPSSGKNLPGIFVAGWSRKPSTGLVGTARKDAVTAARAVDQFMIEKKAAPGIPSGEIEQKLNALGCRIVKKEHLPILEAAEKHQAEVAGLEEFKYSTNEEMLKVIGLD